MIALQIISVCFGIFMLYTARIHSRKGVVNGLEAKTWALLWIIFILAAVFPESMQGLVESLHIARVFDLFVILAFMILAYISFQTRVAVRKMEVKLEHAVRREAMYAAKSAAR